MTTRARRPRPAESGAGLLSTCFGVAAVMLSLGTAVNVALGLWARSTVDAVAYDAARQVATAPVGSDVGAMEEAALERARDVLGSRADEVDMVFEHPGSPRPQVVLHVRAEGVSLLPRAIGGGPVVAALDRRIVLRREVT